jgi:hypothetical protein
LTIAQHFGAGSICDEIARESRQGRLKPSPVRWDNRPWRDSNTFFPLGPSTKVLGYCQPSLRDEALTSPYADPPAYPTSIPRIRVATGKSGGWRRHREAQCGHRVRKQAPINKGGWLGCFVALATGAIRHAWVEWERAPSFVSAREDGTRASDDPLRCCLLQPFGTGSSPYYWCR